MELRRKAENGHKENQPKKMKILKEIPNMSINNSYNSSNISIISISTPPLSPVIGTNQSLFKNVCNLVSSKLQNTPKPSIRSPLGVRDINIIPSPVPNYGSINKLGEKKALPQKRRLVIENGAGNKSEKHNSPVKKVPDENILVKDTYKTGMPLRRETRSTKNLAKPNIGEKKNNENNSENADSTSTNSTKENIRKLTSVRSNARLKAAAAKQGINSIIKSPACDLNKASKSTKENVGKLTSLRSNSKLKIAVKDETNSESLKSDLITSNETNDLETNDSNPSKTTRMTRNASRRNLTKDSTDNKSVEEMTTEKKSSSKSNTDNNMDKSRKSNESNTKDNDKVLRKNPSKRNLKIEDKKIASKIDVNSRSTRRAAGKPANTKEKTKNELSDNLNMSTKGNSLDSTTITKKNLQIAKKTPDLKRKGRNLNKDTPNKKIKGIKATSSKKSIKNNENNSQDIYEFSFNPDEEPKGKGKTKRKSKPKTKKVFSKIPSYGKKAILQLPPVRNAQSNPKTVSNNNALFSQEFINEINKTKQAILNSQKVNNITTCVETTDDGVDIDDFIHCNDYSQDESQFALPDNPKKVINYTLPTPKNFVPTMQATSTPRGQDCEEIVEPPVKSSIENCFGFEDEQESVSHVYCPVDFLSFKDNLQASTNQIKSKAPSRFCPVSHYKTLKKYNELSKISNFTISDSLSSSYNPVKQSRNECSVQLAKKEKKKHKESNENLNPNLNEVSVLFDEEIEQEEKQEQVIIRDSAPAVVNNSPEKSFVNPPRKSYNRKSLELSRKKFLEQYSGGVIEAETEEEDMESPKKKRKITKKKKQPSKKTPKDAETTLETTSIPKVSNKSTKIKPHLMKLYEDWASDINSHFSEVEDFELTVK